MDGKHIFIAYARKDGRFAETLERNLEDAQFSVWRDPDIGAGERWRGAIDDAIRDSSALVVIMSPEAKSSEYVNYEWTFALGAGVTVVPVLLGLPAGDLHPRLAELQALDFTDPLARDWSQLLSRLKQLSGACRPAGPRGLRGLPPALENAARGLDSIDSAERLRAIETLKQINHPDVAEVLAGALQHPVRDVRLAAAFKLLELRDTRGIPELLEGAAATDQVTRLYDGRTCIGPAAVPELVRSLGHSNAVVRKWAVYLLDHLHERFPDLAVLPALTEALGDPDAGVRSAALSAMGKYGTAAPLTPIIERLRDESHQVRDSAASALGCLGGREAAQSLMEALRDPACSVRASAIRALGEVRNTAAVPALVEILEDDNQFHAQAAEALGKIADPAAIPALAQAVEELHTGYAAADALGAIGGPAAVAALLAIVHNQESEGRYRAAMALGKLQDRAVVPELLAALQDEDVRGGAVYALGELKAPESVSALLPLLRDPEQDMRRRTAEALIKIGTAAVPALADALKDDLEDVRSAARQALENIGTREAKAALKAFRRGTAHK